MRFALVCVLVACGARTTPSPPRSADMTPVAGAPAPSHAQLYADCLAQAAANKTYTRAHDRDTELILFTCSGAPAKAFYDGLAAFSAAIGSEYSNRDLTIRATAKVRENLFGVDYCAERKADHTCVITLNAGKFLTAP